MKNSLIQLLVLGVSVNRIYLRVLSLLLVAGSRKSSAHLQRLHTEQFLWVSCPVPYQAFTV